MGNDREVDVESVLIVDDNPSITASLARCMRRKRGRIVLVANDPNEAWELWCRELPDTALVDASLGPGEKSGYELVRDFKVDRPKVLIWMLTGSFSLAYRDLARAVGAAELFEKPVVYADLSRQMFGVAEFAPEDTIEAMKSKHIKNVLRMCDDNRSEAARRLGVRRTTLQKTLKAIGKPVSARSGRPKKDSR